MRLGLADKMSPGVLKRDRFQTDQPVGPGERALMSLSGRTLLLTATVAPPPNARLLARVDPEIRMLDYVWALEFYLNLPNDVIRRIVFVENSNADLTRLRRLADRHPQKQVEFVSFFGLDYSPSFGRGYGEFKLMDHAFEHSESLAKLEPHDPIWKGTGRYRLLNIDKLVRSAPMNYELYCDFRDKPIPWMDLRFFSFSKESYLRNFKGLYPKLSEDLDLGSPEVILRHMFDDRLNEPTIIPRFLCQPRVSGIQAAHNVRYDRTLKDKVKFYVRALMRQVAPSVWV